MHAKRISKWLSESELKIHLNDQSILQWLLEDGSITQKISAHNPNSSQMILQTSDENH